MQFSIQQVKLFFNAKLWLLPCLFYVDCDISVFIYWLQYIILQCGLPAVQHTEFIQILTKEKSWRCYFFIHISCECLCGWLRGVTSLQRNLWMCRTTRTSLGDGCAAYALSTNPWNPLFKQRSEDWSAPLSLLIFSCQCWWSGSLSGVDGHRT